MRVELAEVLLDAVLRWRRALAECRGVHQVARGRPAVVGDGDDEVEEFPLVIGGSGLPATPRSLLQRPELLLGAAGVGLGLVVEVSLEQRPGVLEFPLGRVEVGPIAVPERGDVLAGLLFGVPAENRYSGDGNAGQHTDTINVIIFIMFQL